MVPLRNRALRALIDLADDPRHPSEIKLKAALILLALSDDPERKQGEKEE